MGEPPDEVQPEKAAETLTARATVTAERRFISVGTILESRGASKPQRKHGSAELGAVGCD
jgi:hypothetical protein